MYTSIKQRVGFALLSILLVIVFIGSILCALILPFMSSNGVASADSTSGVVGDNLFLNNDFSKFSGTQISNWHRYTSSNIILSHNEYGLNLLTTSTSNVDYAYLLDYNSHIGETLTFTLCIYYNGEYIYRSLTRTISSATFSISVSLIDGTNNRMYFQKSSTQFKPWFRIVGGYSFTLVWCKLEVGSTFTGYVPKDYENYGYNQGFDAGLSSNFINQNYTLIGSLNLYDSVYSDVPNPLITRSFSLGGYSYNFSEHGEVSVPYEDAATYSYYYPLGSFDLGVFPGVKVTSDYLYGDILITIPYFIYGDYYWRICFEDVSTGELVYTDFRDTLHWSLVPSYSLFVRNSEATTTGASFLDSWNYFLVRYYFSSPQNVYLVPSRLQRVYATSDVDPLLRYPNNEFFNIYSSRDVRSLSSFDEIYDSGYDAGIRYSQQSNAQNVANARSAGYEQGRRDALADQNDYSFYGLLGSVFDAPISAFKGLLNFEILGVNMQSFVVALLSLSVIIIIIKIALGGK